MRNDRCLFARLLLYAGSLVEYVSSKSKSEDVHVEAPIHLSTDAQPRPFLLVEPADRDAHSSIGWSSSGRRAKQHLRLGRFRRLTTLYLGRLRERWKKRGVMRGRGRGLGIGGFLDDDDERVVGSGGG